MLARVPGRLAGLYPIVDIPPGTVEATPELEAYVRTLADVGAALLQLRAKHASPDQRLRLAKAFQAWLQDTQTYLVVNDDPAAAEASGAQWVHVGQGDMPVREVRARYPRLRVGVSTHSLAQLEHALQLAPDYVAYGPVFATQSKVDADPTVGLDGLRQARALAGAIPVVAIGGIDDDNARAVSNHASMGAVISALANANDVRATAMRLHKSLGG
jgi:thiamine-phosphate pyrophosphorylase